MNLGELRRAVNALPDRYDAVPVLVWCAHWDTITRLMLDEDRVVVLHEPFDGRPPVE